MKILPNFKTEDDEKGLGEFLKNIEVMRCKTYAMKIPYLFYANDHIELLLYKQGEE